MATPPSAPAKQGNLFTRKIGPLQTWVWIVLISTPIVLYSLYERSKNAKAAAASTSPATTSGTTSASQVPQFVNQTYTTVEPPSAPASLPTAPVHHRQPPPPAPAPTQPTPQPTPAPQPAPAPPSRGDGHPSPSPSPAPSPGPAGVTEPVPLVVGERANFAIGKLQSLGLGYKSTTGNRNPKATYDVSAQSPSPGTQVPQGTTVSLAFKQVTV